MDVTAEKLRLENEQAALEQYLKHPVTQKILLDNEEEQQALIELVLNRQVVDVETFLVREQALGHLRGLRRAKAIIVDDLEEVKDQLKELK